MPSLSPAEFNALKAANGTRASILLTERSFQITSSLDDFAVRQGSSCTDYLCSAGINTEIHARSANPSASAPTLSADVSELLELDAPARA
jgi:hypothetical protein